MGPITIIGAAGFVGARLVESLVLDGHRDVRVVVRAYRSLAALARLSNTPNPLSDTEPPARTVSTMVSIRPSTRVAAVRRSPVRAASASTSWVLFMA